MNGLFALGLDSLSQVGEAFGGLDREHGQHRVENEIEESQEPSEPAQPVTIVIQCRSCGTFNTDSDRAFPQSKQKFGHGVAACLCFECNAWRVQDPLAVSYTPAKLGKAIVSNTELQEHRDHYIPLIAKKRAESKKMTTQGFNLMPAPKKHLDAVECAKQVLKVTEDLITLAQYRLENPGKNPIQDGYTLEDIVDPATRQSITWCVKAQTGRATRESVREKVFQLTSQIDDGQFNVLDDAMERRLLL